MYSRGKKDGKKIALFRLRIGIPIAIAILIVSYYVAGFVSIGLGSNIGFILEYITIASISIFVVFVAIPNISLGDETIYDWLNTAGMILMGITGVLAWYLVSTEIFPGIPLIFDEGYVMLIVLPGIIGSVLFLGTRSKATVVCGTGKEVNPQTNEK